MSDEQSVIRIPVNQLNQEPGAHELATSPENGTVLSIRQLPLEKRYIWRVVSALKWLFENFESEIVNADKETLTRAIPRGRRCRCGSGQLEVATRDRFEDGRFSRLGRCCLAGVLSHPAWSGNSRERRIDCNRVLVLSHNIAGDFLFHEGQVTAGGY